MSTATPEGVTSRNELEVLVLSTFRDVLARPDLAPDEDFFSAGGDSLGAVAVIERLREATATDIPVALLFVAAAPAQLATAIAELPPRGDE